MLSDSSANYDRGQKFKRYRDLPSLQEYILISSKEMLIEKYTKQSQHFWTFTESNNPEDSLKIEAIGFSCPQKELYRNVAL